MNSSKAMDNYYAHYIIRTNDYNVAIVHLHLVFFRGSEPDEREI